MTQFYTSIFFLFIFLNTLAFSQTADQIKADRLNFIWGEGSGNTLKSADNEALAMLINQISTQVESRFTHLVEEVKDNKKTNFQETYKGVINTYSNATLKNTERIVLNNEPDAKVLRYIRRKDVEKIFSDREKKINEFINNANYFSERGEVAYALKYYYWSLSLLRSHPSANSMIYIDEKGSERLLISWLPLKINSVFSDLNFRVIDKVNDENLVRYILEIKYQDKRVKNFDYSYWTGKDWTNIYSAKNGDGITEFYGGEIDQIRLKAEYIFEGDAKSDEELKEVLNKLELVPFRSSYINIPTKFQANKIPEKNVAAEEIKESEAKKLSLQTKPDLYIASMQRMVDALKTKNYENVKPLFTDEAYIIYEKLLKYGQARIIREPDLKFFEYEKGIMCRAIPMSFHFKNNNRNFVEDVIFYFNESGKISNITFGLEQIAVNDIITKDMWDEKTRLILISFLENYKTAYALKRADYIESIFADDALIIVGSVLKAKNTGDNPYQNSNIIKYNHYSKEQFVRNLKHSFSSNEFVNIQFENNTIRKSGKGGEIYGVQIKQNYYSSNYGDSGYLFLLIDINDPEQPLIHVRTWQSEKSPDGSIYGLGDF